MWEWLTKWFRTDAPAEVVQYVQAVEIESVHGSAEGQRMVFYRAQDRQGNWHSYGPVITVDCGFDCEQHCAVVAERLAEVFAERERLAVEW